jgi:hypothetical protein
VTDDERGPRYEHGQERGAGEIFKALYHSRALRHDAISSRFMLASFRPLIGFTN